MTDPMAGITCSRCGRALYAKDGPTCPECMALAKEARQLAAEIVRIGQEQLAEEANGGKPKVKAK